MGYPQMKYPNMFDTESAALDAAWGLYEGYNEAQVRRKPVQVRPLSWRLPSIMAVLCIKVPPSPHRNSLPKEYTP